MPIRRRDFLKISLGGSTLLALSSPLGESLSQSAEPPAPQRHDRDTVLVLLQLSGGNDGLNTVVPFEDDLYHRSRPTLRLAAQRLHKLDAQLGFHPDAPAFGRLYHEGQLSVLQGVGYPDSDRNHDGAMRDWHTARPGLALCPTGWVGGAIDHVPDAADRDLPAVFVGSTPTPFNLQTEKAVVPAIRSLSDWGLAQSTADARPLPSRKRPARSAAAALPSQTHPLLALAQHITRRAWASAARLEAVVAEGRRANPVEYPPFGLAGTLQTVAQLIRANLGIRIFAAEFGGGGIGGFDTHANQAANHGALLRQLSESIVAFVADLRRDRLLDRVLLVTFSEFGRTVAENGRRGTDHGAAAPLFLVGGKLKGGLIGSHPSLSDLDGGGLKFQTDFRRVYATLLDHWLGFDSLAILGERFEPVDFLESI